MLYDCDFREITSKSGPFTRTGNASKVTIAQAERATVGLCGNDEGLNFSVPHLGLSDQKVEEKYVSVEAVDDMELNELTMLEDENLYAAVMRVIQHVLHEMALAGMM